MRRKRMWWAIGFSIVFMIAIQSQAHSQELVYEQSFDDPGSIEEFWLSHNPSAKKIVNADDGAYCYSESCLRGNWVRNYQDPITQLWTVDSVASRYAGYDLVVANMGITDEMFVDYRAYVDSDAHKAYGAKWIWLDGTYRIPGEYGHAFNHLIQPPWEGWDTWRIIRNNSVGDSGGESRSARLSENSCILERLEGLGVDEWFQGRWHRFQVYMRLNTPASEFNGILRFWIDGCPILELDDYKYRDVDDDLIRNIVTPHMYGGGDPPPGTFGWQLDELRIYNGFPADMDFDPGEIPLPPSHVGHTGQRVSGGCYVSSVSGHLLWMLGPAFWALRRRAKIR